MYAIRSYYGTMEVSVPTRFMRDWIQTHYAVRISAMYSEKNCEIKRVQIVVVQNAIIDDAFSSQDKAVAVSSVREQEGLRAAIAEISSPLDPRFTFDRITSYNVCYTKLLRLETKSFSIKVSSVR